MARGMLLSCCWAESSGRGCEKGALTSSVVRSWKGCSCASVGEHAEAQRVLAWRVVLSKRPDCLPSGLTSSSSSCSSCDASAAARGTKRSAARPPGLTHGDNRRGATCRVLSAAPTERLRPSSTCCCRPMCCIAISAPRTHGRNELSGWNADAGELVAQHSRRERGGKAPGRMLMIARG